MGQYFEPKLGEVSLSLGAIWSAICISNFTWPKHMVLCRMNMNIIPFEKDIRHSEEHQNWCPFLGMWSTLWRSDCTDFTTKRPLTRIQDAFFLHSGWDAIRITWQLLVSPLDLLAETMRMVFLFQAIEFGVLMQLVCFSIGLTLNESTSHLSPQS